MSGAFWVNINNYYCYYYHNYIQKKNHFEGLIKHVAKKITPGLLTIVVPKYQVELIFKV